MSSPAWMLPSPRRSEVAKRNRAKRRGITEEGRQRLRESALAHKPWEHSSGPKTPWGKYYSAWNGKVLQKGEYSVREARAEIKAYKKLMMFLLAHPELGEFDRK